MVKLIPSTLFRVLAALAAGAIGAMVLICATMRIPVQQRLANLANASQTVSMTCRHLQGYQLVLGVPCGYLPLAVLGYGDVAEPWTECRGARSAAGSIANFLSKLNRNVPSLT